MATVPESSEEACATPLSCGQVYKAGYYLYDNAGRWRVNGVQFMLPQHGINTWTFHDDRYQASVEDGSLDYWLGKAETYLLARTLRIFVELPSSENVPTSVETIYDFALKANQRGMRLGLVLHNDSGFTMASWWETWINQLVDYFEARNAKSLIAYVSSDNEINNYCGGKDCIDNDQAYLDEAVKWTAEFTQLFKSRQSGILVTVGMSTEVEDRDGKPATANFFKKDSQGRTLAGLVDFISPHNYGGGGYGIIEDLRGRGYQGPVVLEEYGYPTDPKGATAPKSYYTEGAARCRTEPRSNECVNTAPYFVEVNAMAIREMSYAGGVAWMIADINNHRCSDVSDLFTGLFAVPGQYCGGTSSTGEGQDKATAFRVRTHHYYYNSPEQVLGAGTYDDSLGAFFFSGSWTQQSNVPNAGWNTLSRSNVAGSKARFRFKGSRFTLWYSMMPDGGSSQVWIDGVNKGTISHKAPELRQQIGKTWEVAAGEHWAEIMVQGGGVTEIDMASVDLFAAGPGIYDDSHSQLRYLGSWAHPSTIDGAWNNTLSWTNVQGAFARFTFIGNEAHYMHSKAFNRGKVAVTIDGVDKGYIDLYSASTIRQQVSSFSNLGPGVHVIHLTVTNNFVDIDRLEIK